MLRAHAASGTLTLLLARPDCLRAAAWCTRMCNFMHIPLTLGLTHFRMYFSLHAGDGCRGCCRRRDRCRRRRAAARSRLEATKEYESRSYYWSKKSSGEQGAATLALARTDIRYMPLPPSFNARPFTMLTYISVFGAVSHAESFESGACPPRAACRVLLH